MNMYQRTKRDAKRAARDAYQGQKLYIVHDVAQNLAPYEDAQLYSEYTVSHRHVLTGSWMVANSLSVELLVMRDGPVYTSPPAGIRNVATPGPQVAGPDPSKPAKQAKRGILARR